MKTNDSEESYVIALDRKEELEKLFQTELQIVSRIEGLWIIIHLTGQCPKHFEDFIVRIRAKN